MRCSTMKYKIFHLSIVFTIVLFSLVLLFSAGCSLLLPDDSSESKAIDYYPLSVGNSWTYAMSTGGDEIRYVRTIVMSISDSSAIPRYHLKKYSRHQGFEGWTFEESWDSYVLEDQVYKDTSPSDPFNSDSLIITVLNPDDWEEGDTLFIEKKESLTVTGRLRSKNETIQLEDWTFSRCYIIEYEKTIFYGNGVTSTSYYEFYYAKNVGLIKTRRFMLNYSNPPDTTVTSWKKLSDYHVFDKSHLTTPSKAQFISPPNQATYVNPNENAYSSYEDIPDSLFALYSEFVESYHNQFFFFDYNRNHVPDNFYLEWSCDSHQPIIYDIYFGTTNPPPLIAEDYILFTDSKIMWETIPNRIYYWRIDVKHQPGGSTTRGDLWTFDTRINEY